MSRILHRHGYRVLKLGTASFLLRPRMMLGSTLLALLTLAFAIGALLHGSLEISSQDVFWGLIRPDAATREQHYILWDIRLPRVFMAVLSGAMLGMAGGAMQSITRNSLADPGLIGVKEAASIVVLAMVILFPATNMLWRPLAGMAGGLLVALCVVLLARDVSRTRFILVGIGVSWLLSSGIAIFITTADIKDVQAALVWMAGSLHAATWHTLFIAAGWALIGAIILFATARAADVAQLGDSIAAGLGLRRRQLEALRFAAPVLMTAGSVSCVGSLGFVGLIAPHISRFTIGGNQTALLAGSALYGAILVLIADTIGRLAFAPLQIPAGIVMTVIGAPFFLALLWQRRDQL